MSAVAVERKLIVALRVIAGSMPGKDYPPANVAKMIRECEALGREDLGQQIMMQWNKVVEKYPTVRVNWGAATKIGTASIKKNVFGRQEFSQWLAQKEDLPDDVKQQVKAIPTIAQAPKGTPKIAIPTDSETPEDWAAEAEKTKARIADMQAAFESTGEFISYMGKEIGEIKEKIVKYGPGGDKHKTGKGKISKMAERVPKWKAQLEVYEAQLEAVESAMNEAKTDMAAATQAYENAPATTVAYEKKAQSNLDSVLKHILSMEDIEKQQEMLEKFNTTLEKLDKKASAHLITADIWDSAYTLFENIMTTIKNKAAQIANWVKGLNASVNTFSELANIRAVEGGE